MIVKHSIKKNGNNEVLYLYLDYSYEFSTFKNIKIIDSIKDYINKNKIVFNGTKVVLVVGSLFLGTIILNNSINYDKTSTKDNYTYVSKITLNNYNSNNKIESITKVDTKNKSVKTTTIKTAKKSTTNYKKTTTKKISVKKKISTKKNTSNKTSTKTTNKITNKTNTSVKKETSSNINVTIYRSNGKVLKLELEEYLVGVVAAEMPASFNLEALKAQAVAARTYTLKSIKTGKKLTDTVSTQVYKDNNELKNMWGSSYNTYYNKIKNAVNATKGIYISYNNDYIDALFHSTSNGYTEDAVNVWGNNIPYLKSVASPLDKNTTSYLRTITKTYKELEKQLGYPLDKNTTINIVRNKSNRVSTITINNKTYTGVEFREKLALRSTDFDIDLNDNITITTRGYGHGVGLSQYGSNELAKKGYSYDRIIKFYYTGISINKIK